MRTSVRQSGTRTALAVLLLAAACAGAQTEPRVFVGTLDGPLGPIAAGYLHDELGRAAAAGAELFVLRLDTPGGLEATMRSMVRDILASPVPVAVWVAPPGARAASAGLFLLEAAHVAAMAPATDTGAAHPVTIGAAMDSVMSAKVANDAAAFMRGLAARRGRNQDWCEQAVRRSVAVPAEEALRLGLVDLIAPDLPALLAGCDGRRVQLAGSERVLRTAGAAVVPRPAGWRLQLLQHLTDPTLAYLFLLLGFYGLFFELGNPGAIVPGVVGALALLLAFLAFQSLPVNTVGVLLIALGMVLLLLEVKVTSHGVLGIGGGASLLLGSLVLFHATPAFGALSLWVVLPAVGATVLFFIMAVGLGLRAQRGKHRTGLETLPGTSAEVLRDDGAVPGGFGGRIRLLGEIWEARAERPLRRGERVRVTGRDGRVLIVAPEAPEDPAPPA